MGNKNKLSLAMIVKNETKSLKKCLDSVKGYVDEIVVAWNGDNTETGKILHEYGCKVVPYTWEDDFAKARNFSFEATTNPFVLWLDADDTLECADQLPSLMTQFDDPHLGALWFLYDYDQDLYGNTTMVVWRERIVRKEWFKWSGTLHEECLKVNDCIQNRVPQEQIFVKHHPMEDRVRKSGERNLRISENKYIEEHKNNKIDPFSVWNYARSLNAMGFIDKAEDVFKEFIGITSSDAHRYQAAGILSEIHRKTGEYNKAIDVDMSRIKIKPRWPDAYFDMANTYFCMEKWDDVIFYTERGYALKHPGQELPVPYDPMSVTYKPLEPLTFSLVQLGRFKEAMTATLKGLEYKPKSEYFLNWKKTISELIEREKIEKTTLELYKHLDANEPEKLKSFVNAIPEACRDHPAFVWLSNKYKPSNGKNKLIIYCGSSITLWDPKSEGEGIGGSEEAVINISRELAKLGWNVEVYNNCLEEGIYDGVLWRGIWQYDNTQPCDVFVAWRDTRSITLAPEGSLSILWLHDVAQYEHFTIEQLNRVDKIFVLSKWHRTVLPKIPSDKFWYTSNGILPQQFIDKVKRNPKACIYASSPDRGLDRVLESWPTIRKEVPDAELNVFYGFTKVYDQIHENDERMKAYKEKVLELLKQDGVKYHGMVSHKELAKYFLYSGLWLYPTSFTEISCITAMKAQAGGAIPICSNVAALDETVQYGTKLNGFSEEDGLKPETLDGWVDTVIDYLNNPEKQEEIRDDMIKWGRGFYGWDSVAIRWDNKFKEMLDSEVKK